ncbi:MAG: creatininase family protein [Bdellovibrionota bacterium]|nr:creatininase family protein [Bdellovibrionota bacterium]
MSQLKNLTWPMVEEYLKHSQSIVLLIGSCEQHGPTGLIGTDFMTAEALAEKYCQENSVIMAPSFNYGMAGHHLGFPGTISLSPDTYTKALIDLFQSMIHTGFKKVLVINGHGGNVPFVQAAVCQLKYDNKNSEFETYLENWWKSPSLENYQEKNFGEANGFHATCGEVSLTQHIAAEAFESIENIQFEYDSKKPLHHPLSASELRKYYPDGRMNSNPGLATKEHGAELEKLYLEYLNQRYEGIIHGL